MSGTESTEKKSMRSGGQKLLPDEVTLWWMDGWRSGSHSSRSVIIILAGRSCAGCKFVMYVMTG